MLLLYGSETGNAEDIAFKAFNYLKLKYNDVQISSMSEYDINCLADERIVMFFVSTTGDGDVPSDMKLFWKYLLKKNLPADCLKSLRHAVFGLGDSSYEKYNSAARRLKKRLEQLGSEELLEIGLGDDQAKYSYIVTYDKWMCNLDSKLYEIIPNEFISSKYNQNVSSETNRSHYQISTSDFQNEVNDTTFYKHPARCKQPSDSNSGPILTKLISNTRLTNSTWNQDVRHIVLQFPNIIQEKPYIAGDVAVIYPENDPTLALRAKTLFSKYCPHMVSHSIIKISSDMKYSRKSRLSTIVCSIDELFGKYLDIAGRPKRTFFEIIASYASNVEERDKLIELSSAIGTDLFFDYCVNEKRNYIEILEDFPSLSLPLSILIEAIPVIQPRYYSIASHSGIYSDQVHLCIAVEKSRTRHGRKVHGLCSNYLANLSIGNIVRMYIQSGVYQMPLLPFPTASPLSLPSLSPSTLSVLKPMILIGPGTGIAPIRALLQQRLQIIFSNIKTKSFSKTLVFTGNRKMEQDFLYCNEWPKIMNICTDYLKDNDNSKSFENSLYDIWTNPSIYNDEQNINISETMQCQDDVNIVNIFSAFSQDEQKKIYVTHKLRQYGKLVCELITKDEGTIFISGSAKRMPIDVKNTIIDILVEHSNGYVSSKEEGYQFIQLLEKQKRYINDVW